MLSRTVTYRVEGHVACVTLNRPEAGNAVNAAMAAELADICEHINQEDDIRVALLSAAGPSFCTGAEEPGSAARSLASVNKALVAALQGDALGAGLELALACDIRLTAATARLGLPQVRAGAMPRDGGTQRLSRLVGRGKALEILLTGEFIEAAEAQRIGLVSRVLPGERLAPEAQALVERMAQMAPWSLRFAKEAVNEGLDLTLEQGLRLEADLYFLMQTTRDRVEGVTAFLQRRTPRFEGK